MGWESPPGRPTGWPFPFQLLEPLFIRSASPSCSAHQLAQTGWPLLLLLLHSEPACQECLLCSAASAAIRGRHPPAYPPPSLHPAEGLVVLFSTVPLQKHHSLTEDSLLLNMSGAH